MVEAAERSILRQVAKSRFRIPNPRFAGPLNEKGPQPVLGPQGLKFHGGEPKALGPDLLNNHRHGVRTADGEAAIRVGGRGKHRFLRAL
jgi:hypothetical protein